MEDNTVCKGELINLCSQLCSGIITSVSAGENLVIDDAVLQTMEVQFATAKCVSYVLLRRQGNLEHADITRYLFKGKNCRDNAMELCNCATL